MLAVQDLTGLDGGAHAGIVDLALTVDAALGRERAVGLDKPLWWDARLAL